MGGAKLAVVHTGVARPVFTQEICESQWHSISVKTVDVLLPGKCLEGGSRLAFAYRSEVQVDHCRLQRAVA